MVSLQNDALVLALVEQFSGGSTAKVEMPDGDQIAVNLSADSNLKDEYAEIIGRVIDSNTVKMYKAFNLGHNIDMPAVNHTIELMHTPLMAPYWHTIAD